MCRRKGVDRNGGVVLRGSFFFCFFAPVCGVQHSLLCCVCVCVCFGCVSLNSGVLVWVELTEVGEEGRPTLLLLFLFQYTDKFEMTSSKEDAYHFPPPAIDDFRSKWHYLYIYRGPKRSPPACAKCSDATSLPHFYQNIYTVGETSAFPSRLIHIRTHT